MDALVEGLRSLHPSWGRIAPLPHVPADDAHDFEFSIGDGDKARGRGDVDYKRRRIFLSISLSVVLIYTCGGSEGTCLGTLWLLT